MAHSANPQEVANVLAFLQKCSPPNNECKIKLTEMSIKELKAAIQKARIGSKAVVGLMEKSEFVALLRNYRAGKL
ncbi:hypothetical protein ACHAWX_000019 [Stephanocyclus meneghinianus]